MRLAAISLSMLVLAGCQRGASESAGAASNQSVASSDPVQLSAPGLHNLFRVSERIYSGSSPEGEAGFASLARLGVKTVVSVDGARPDLEAAHRHGLKYVHLPFGYNGVPEDRVLALAHAALSVPGPIYVHCHHGKHRGPAAVAVMQLCTDKDWDAKKAKSWLKMAGTDPRYTGLMHLPETLHRPTMAELEQTTIPLPEVTPIADLQRVMVEVDARWDNLKLVKDAGWVRPKQHPDIDPPHEAVQLGEYFREAGRLDSARRRGPDFLRLLHEAEAASGELEKSLRAGRDNSENAIKAFDKLAGSCTACHAQFRDHAAVP